MMEPEDTIPQKRPAIVAAAFDEAESLEVIEVEAVDTVPAVEE